MARQTVKNPSNLQIVWDDGAVLVFSFAGAAADGGATINCGIVHLAPHLQVPELSLRPINAIQNTIQHSGQLYADPQTWIETIKGAARGRFPNIQIDYDDQFAIQYTSYVFSNPPSFTLQFLYSLAG
jgi:hypothetical protein